MTNERGGALYAGFDDSNHAGTAKGEIIVATFSYLFEDSLKRKFPNTRDTSFAYRWLNHPGRDMRFTLLTNEANRHCSFNLPLVANFLVNHYLKSASLAPSDLELYFDGAVRSQHKKIVVEEFKPYFDRVTAKDFIKKVTRKGGRRKGISSKRHDCPTPIYVADSISNNLLSREVGFLLTDSRFVEVPEDLSERIKMFRSA